MKALISIILLSLLPLSSFSQAKNDIVIGEIDSLQSTILNENRKIWVHIPDNDPNSIYIQQNYPVIYLLDGPGHFTSVVGMMDHLSNNSLLPKMIVVGIPNTDRTRDLTPTKAKPNPPMMDSTFAEASGGGKNFLKFLEKELIPYIDSNYPTKPHRMLIGHSLGGLFVIDAFIDKPQLFSSYISIDPSMWWDDRLLQRKIKESVLENQVYKNKNLYLGIANTLEGGLDTLTVKKDTTFRTDHIRSILDLRDDLVLKSKDNFNFKSKYYGKDSHGSAPLITTYDGLRFMYSFYDYQLPFEKLMDGQIEVLNDIKEHYQVVSSKLGYTTQPEESFLNNMGYQFMNMDKPSVAKKFFELNIEYYPSSANVYDSMGDYYAGNNDKKNAQVYFEKALAIKENKLTREKLEALQNE